MLRGYTPYLFYIAYKFHKSKELQYDYFYMMPNALRKILDIFLAFKLPGGTGLVNKIEEVAKRDEWDIDPARLHSLERLVQLESHADSLDDLVTFSSMTIEQTKDAADTLMAMIEAMDGTHFKKQCRLCRD